MSIVHELTITYPATHENISADRLVKLVNDPKFDHHSADLFLGTLVRAKVLAPKFFAFTKGPEWNEWARMGPHYMTTWDDVISGSSILELRIRANDLIAELQHAFAKSDFSAMERTTNDLSSVVSDIQERQKLLALAKDQRSKSPIQDFEKLQSQIHRAAWDSYIEISQTLPIALVIPMHASPSVRLYSVEDAEAWIKENCQL